MVREGAGTRLYAITARLARTQLVAPLLALLFYCLAFIGLVHVLGPGVAVMSMVPVGLVAWAVGARGGLLAGILAFPLNTALLGLSVPASGPLGMIQGGGAPESLAIGLAGFVIGYLRDADLRRKGELAERMRTEEALRESEARKGAILESSADCIIAMDVSGCVVEFNSAAERTFGFRRGYAVGRSMIDLIIPARDRPALREAVGGMMRISYRNPVCRTFEAMALRSDGTEVPVEISLSVFHYGSQTVCSASVRDITERRLQQEALQYQAYHDALTGLPNRALFHDRLEQAILQAEREHHPVALLIMDLNGFKEVNDTLGHHYGDELLREVAERLRHEIRASDTVARLGGDEFGIILPQVDDRAAAQVLSQKLETILEPSFELDHHLLRVRASIGLALYPEDGNDGNAVLRRADAAMYTTKRGSRGGRSRHKPGG